MKKIIMLMFIAFTLSACAVSPIVGKTGKELATEESPCGSNEIDTYASRKGKFIYYAPYGPERCVPIGGTSE